MCATKRWKHPGCSISAIPRSCSACMRTTALNWLPSFHGSRPWVSPPRSIFRCPIPAVRQDALTGTPFSGQHCPTSTCSCPARRKSCSCCAAVSEHSRSLDAIEPSLIAELGQELLDRGAKIVALKIGERGLYLRTAGIQALTQLGRCQVADVAVWSNRELWSPCFATRVADTTGSGDATIAGFLLGLLRAMTPEAALSAACAVGACSVESVDALSGLRSWSETEARLTAGWARVPIDLYATNTGWRWGSDHNLWIGPIDAHR
jgi:hypothetical protein